MFSAMARILILYSNPSDSDRLRLDKEERALDQILKRRNIDRSLVDKYHATSVKDFVKALRLDDYEIIQFSGHGSDDGIYLENDQIDGGKIVDAGRIAALLQEALPDLKATILVSCFSNSFINEIVNAAVHTITMDGSANDDAAIEFVTAFYDSYFEFNSVENAFRNACVSIDAIGKGQDIKPLLYRRAKEKSKQGIQIQAFFDRREDSVYIDLTEAEKDIASLDISYDAFLVLLTRKIRIHKWVFKVPRERALLSIGRYFGEFSWKDPSDVIVCHKIMRVASDVPDSLYDLWAKIVVTYNDLACQRYRIMPNPASAENDGLLKKALDEHYRCYQTFIEVGQYAKLLRSSITDQFRASKALISSNLSQADVMLGRGDLPMLLTCLEVSLSSIHDLVDSLTAVVTNPKQRQFKKNKRQKTKKIKK